MMKQGYSWTSVLREIEKCVVRCSNCHRKKTVGSPLWYTDFETYAQQIADASAQCRTPQIPLERLLPIACPQCSSPFVRAWATQRFCKAKCAHKAAQRFDLTAAELREIVWLQPVASVGRLLGVSGTAVKSRCDKLGIPVPGRGYWSKMRAQQQRDTEDAV